MYTAMATIKFWHFESFSSIKLCIFQKALTEKGLYFKYSRSNTKGRGFLNQSSFLFTFITDSNQIKKMSIRFYYEYGQEKIVYEKESNSFPSNNLGSH